MARPLPQKQQAAYPPPGHQDVSVRDERFHIAQDYPRTLGGDRRGEAIELLNGGNKLELEGATNPAFYLPALTRELESNLFGLP
jgi:hypothetical protein